MINLEDKKILVLGFARSGYSTAKILNKLGYDVKHPSMYSLD